ncbi:uncharacterized protein LOC123674643 [Harmonia axyridis]|uniref:uncharacterized protein LOC123674643 n=1 Tax=Harmonia axyridis TaxID=115357 RepID=UPI001E277F6F|nr:uncharacterized protein LOC123674643 [Harmonia axyridis]
MEEKQDKSKADLDEEENRNDSPELSTSTKENVQCTLKSTSSAKYSPCINTYIVDEGEAENDVEIVTYKLFRCSTPTEDKEIMTANMATNQDRIRMAPKDHTNVVYRSDESEDEDEDDNMMTIIEKVINDFDEKSRLKNNRQKNASLELINLSKSSDETEDRNDRIEAMMSWNPDETKKFQTLKIPEVDQDPDYERYLQNAELEHVLSDNSLLAEAISQLRLKFKLFLSDLDLKTNILRSPQKNFVLPSKCLGGKYGNKASVRANNGPKMSVLEIIEASRQARRKQLASLRNYAKKSNVPFTKHFDTDGTCCRNDGHEDVLSILSRDPEHRRYLKFVLSTLLIELQKCERYVVNISLENEDEVKDITDRQDELCDRILYSKTIEKEEERGVECKTLMKHMGPTPRYVLPKRELKKTYHHLRVTNAHRKRRTGNELNSHTDSNLPSRNDKKESPPERIFNDNSDISINTTSSAINSSRPMELPFHESPNLSTSLIGTPQAPTTEELHLQNDQIKDHVEVEKTCLDTGDSKTSAKAVDNLKLSPQMRNVSTDGVQGSPCSDLLDDLIISTPSDDGGESNFIRYPIEEPIVYYIKNTSTEEPNQEGETSGGIEIVEGSNRSDRAVPSQNSPSPGQQEDGRNTHDESSSVSGVVCSNFQSTCLHFDIMKKFLDELETVVIQAESDITEELEKLGNYEDFEKPLLEEARRLSED